MPHGASKTPSGAWGSAFPSGAWEREVGKEFAEVKFKAGGRLGCPQDYEVFQSALEPLLERIHRAHRHVGKVPPHASADAVRQRDLIDLRLELRQAVEQEAYEEAAKVRDRIRALEAP